MTRLAQLFNNAVSKLAAGITSSATSITLETGDGAKFPALTTGQFFMATLVKGDGTIETVKVTARTSDTLTVERAAEAVGGVQTAYAFSAGDRIEHRLTAGVLGGELDRLDQAAYVGTLNKSANYTLVAGDISTLVRVNTGSGAVTITLPEISTLTQDYDVLVAKVTSDTNVVTVARSGSDTINGATNVSLTTQWQSIWFVADRISNVWTAITSGNGVVNAVVDTFTGSGTAGPFTLSADPGSANNLAVYVGGVYQQRSTFTLSGTSLTLGGAVASGVVVEAVYTTALPIGTPSDGSVTAAKLGTSAVTTAKIHGGAVTTGKLQDGAVTAAKVSSEIATVSGTQTLSDKILASNTTATTQNAKTSNTSLATTEFVDRLRSLLTQTTASTGGTLVIGDRGTLVEVTAGVTVPANVFAQGDVVTIYNDSAANITITQGVSPAMTLRQVGTANTGNRTLAQRGLATIVFVSATEAVISGGGLS